MCNKYKRYTTLTYIVFTAYTDLYYIYGLHWPILSLRPTLTYIVFTAYTDLYCLYCLHWPILPLRPTLTYIIFTAYTDLYCLYCLHWPILSLRPTLTYIVFTAYTDLYYLYGLHLPIVLWRVWVPPLPHWAEQDVHTPNLFQTQFRRTQHECVLQPRLSLVLPVQALPPQEGDLTLCVRIN